MKKMMPDFLRQIDHKLLTSYPLVWRTRVHYFLFFALVGNLLAMLLPVLSISILGAFPTENTLYGFLMLGLVFCGFLLLFWGFDQQRFKVFPSTLENFIKTIGLYAICVLSVASVFFMGTYTTIHQIASKGINGSAIMHYDFLEKTKLLNSYRIASEYQKSTAEMEKAKQILTFFNCDYEVISSDQIKVNQVSQLGKRASIYSSAQAHVYNTKTRGYSSLSDLFHAMMFLGLIALLLVPTFLVVWSGIGFPLTIVVVGIQSVLSALIIGFTFTLNSNGGGLPIGFLFALLLVIGCITGITKPNKISLFLAWSAISFAPIFLLMLFLSIMVSIPSTTSRYLSFVIPIGLLIAGVSVFLTGAMGYLVASRVGLPKAE